MNSKNFPKTIVERRPNSQSRIPRWPGKFVQPTICTNSRAHDQSSDSMDTFNPRVRDASIGSRQFRCELYACTAVLANIGGLGEECRSRRDLDFVNRNNHENFPDRGYGFALDDRTSEANRVCEVENLVANRTRRRYACTCNRSRALNDKVGHPNVQL